MKRPRVTMGDRYPPDIKHYFKCLYILVSDLISNIYSFPFFMSSSNRRRGSALRTYAYKPYIVALSRGPILFDHSSKLKQTMKMMTMMMMIIKHCVSILLMLVLFPKFNIAHIK